MFSAYEGMARGSLQLCVMCAWSLKPGAWPLHSPPTWSNKCKVRQDRTVNDIQRRIRRNTCNLRMGGKVLQRLWEQLRPEVRAERKGRNRPEER